MKKLILAAAILSTVTACSTSPSHQKEVSYGNDALPSEEVISFQKIDKELKFKNARIEYDKNSCAVYEGINSKGEKEQKLLLNKDGRKFCH